MLIAAMESIHMREKGYFSKEMQKGTGPLILLESMAFYFFKKIRPHYSAQTGLEPILQLE